MVEAKCGVANCEFVLEDADNIDDACEQMRRHNRVEHPRKAFYDNTFKEGCEIYNTTFEEYMLRQWGAENWIDHPADCISWVRRLIRDYKTYYCAATIRAGEEFLAEFERNNPQQVADQGQPNPPPPAGGFARFWAAAADPFLPGGAGPLIPEVELAVDDAVEEDDDPIEF